MRLDDRLREGFERNGSAVQPDVDVVLASVVLATHRRARTRRSVVAFSVVLSAVAVVLLAPRSLSFLRDDRAPQSGNIGIVTPTPSHVRDPLVGTWRVSHTCGEESAALERVGLTNVAARLNMRCSGPSTTTAVFRDGRVTLDDPVTGAAWTSPYHVIDAHTFDAGEHLPHFDRLETTDVNIDVGRVGGTLLRYRFTVRGNTLTVQLEKDNYPIPIPGPNQQMADLIAQTIWWNSAPFQRAG